MRTFLKKFLPIIALLLLTAGWKLIFVLRDTVPFNSDEAIVALMARHILMGARPVFFYGQAYMGSLDAWLVAGGFVLFGQQVWVIRLVQALLYLGTLWTTWLLGQRAFRSRHTGWLAALLLAVPTVNMTVYTTASLGGYGEALLLGNLMLLVSLDLYRRAQSGARLSMASFAVWGLFAGLGLWANGLTLVFSAPSGIFLLWLLVKQRRGAQACKALAWIALGVAAGASPWWLHALRIGPQQLVAELFGTAVAVEGSPWLAQVGQHLLSFVLFGLTALFGLRPPWDITWLALPLLPLALAFWLAVIGWMVRSSLRAEGEHAPRRLLLGVILTVTAGFLFTPFGVDPSGRYFLPMSVPLALFAADLAQRVSPRPRWQAALIGTVVVFQAWGTLQAAALPPGLTTQFYQPSVVDHRYDDELMRFLDAKGETRGYTNYWVAYPLAFKSQERIIFIPALPYHPDLRYTARDNRYAPYTAEVERSPRAAYIVTRNPPLTAALRQGFKRLGVTWQETQIGDFEVFYGLSRHVRPAELGVGLGR